MLAWHEKADSVERRREFLRVSRLTLPYDGHMPTQVLQRRDIPGISPAVLVQLCGPKIRIGLRPADSTVAHRASMPVAAMNEHNGSMPWKNDIGPSGEIPPVQPKPQSAGMHGSANR
jgi:hypothetical protein